MDVKSTGIALRTRPNLSRSISVCNDSRAASNAAVVVRAPAGEAGGVRCPPLYGVSTCPPVVDVRSIFILGTNSSFHADTSAATAAR